MVDKSKEAAKVEIHYLAISSVSLYLIGMSALFALIVLHYFKPVKAMDFF